MSSVKLIGICGGSGSGKTTIVREIEKVFADFIFLPQDNYYRSVSNISNQNITDYNFDHPDAFDTELIVEHLKALKNSQAIEMPQYDFVHHCRKQETVFTEPKRIVIFDGIMIFFHKEIRDLIDLKLYVDTPDDIRFIRRLQRDIIERGRTVDSVIRQYMERVRPGHYEFTEPTKMYADLIIPEGGYNESALQVLLSFLKQSVA